VLSNRSNLTVVGALLAAVFLWGGTNAGTRFLVGHSEAAWPPIWTGGTRFLCAGLMLLGLLRLSPALGMHHSLTPMLRRRLWLQGGLSLTIYIMAFYGALRFTSASHVALYLGTAPVWALLWEGRPVDARIATRRYGAALLALTGVAVLLWPTLATSSFTLKGELLGLSCSVLWTNYGRQCRHLAQELGGVEVSAHTMWRAGVLLMPIGALEILTQGFHPTVWQTGVQAYCIVAGGVVAFAIWNMALRRWSTSRVYLFNNLVPISTMVWAHFTLDENVTPTFWTAMALIIAGVLLGQAHHFKREVRARTGN
jgi:drug/metabolite transporter (DMT)-like permease